MRPFVFADENMSSNRAQVSVPSERVHKFGQSYCGLRTTPLTSKCQRFSRTTIKAKIGILVLFGQVLRRGQ